MEEDKTLGRRITERFFLGFGTIIFAIGIIIAINDPAGLFVVLGGMVSLLLFGITRLVERLWRRIATRHWTRAVPERFSVAQAVWYFFIALGPPLLIAAYADIIMERPGAYLISTGFILMIFMASSAFTAIDRALVKSRMRPKLLKKDETPRE